MTNDQILGSSLEPLHGLFSQGLIIAKGYTCRAAASAANAFVSIHIYGALLVYDRVHTAYGFSKTDLAVMPTDNV
jgi:hypothetical protein